MSDALGMAGAEGLELSTSGFGDRRSSQLSYAPSPFQHKGAFHTLAGFVSSLKQFALLTQTRQPPSPTHQTP